MPGAPDGDACFIGRGQMPARQHRQLHPRSPFEKIGEVEVAFTLLRAEIAGRQEPAEPSIGGAVSRPDSNVRRAIAESQPAANDVTGASRLRGKMAAHNAGERIAVGDREAGETQNRSRRGELFGMRGAAQKRKIRSCEKLGIGLLAREADTRSLRFSTGQGEKRNDWPRAAGGRFFRHKSICRGKRRLPQGYFSPVRSYYVLENKGVNSRPCNANHIRKI